MMIRLLLPSARQLLTFLVFAVPSKALYYKDDTNSSIQYLGTSWSQINPENQPWVNSTEVYFQTLTHSECKTTDNCHVLIPFTGSGITIYNAIRSSINVTIVVDGGSPTAFTFTDDNSCLNATKVACFNTSIYDIQFLAYGDHHLDITMFTVPLSAKNFSYSDFYLDYAAVNDTSTDVTSPFSIISPNPTSLSTPTKTSPIPNPGPHKKWTPPKLEGFIIGLLVFVVFVFVIICIYVRKRFRNRRPLNDGTELPTTTTPIGDFGPPGPLVAEHVPLQPSQDLDSSPTAASGLTLPSLTTQDAAEAVPAILDTPPATPPKDVDSVHPEVTPSEDPSHTSKQSAYLSVNASGTTCVETAKSAL